MTTQKEEEKEEVVRTVKVLVVNNSLMRGKFQTSKLQANFLQRIKISRSNLEKTESIKKVLVLIIWV